MSTPAFSDVAQPSAAKSKEQTVKLTRFIIVHGDKGGVGKSFVAQALADVLAIEGGKVAVIDADTSNPDVSRMFADSMPSIRTDVRSENGNGWMDVMDFVTEHAGFTIVMNTPAGIGDSMKSDMASFATFLSEQETPVEMELWWVMNIQHDSVNLLNMAYSSYGQYFSRIRVVCNLFFANGDKSDHGPYFLWNESPLKANIEKKNGATIYFPGLHGRVVKKLFDPEKIMPFSQAVDAVVGESLDLSSSERWKLQQWMSDVKGLFSSTLTQGSTATSATTEKIKSR